MFDPLCSRFPRLLCLFCWYRRKWHQNPIFRNHDQGCKELICTHLSHLQHVLGPNKSCIGYIEMSPDPTATDDRGAGGAGNPRSKSNRAEQTLKVEPKSNTSGSIATLFRCKGPNQTELPKRDVPKTVVPVQLTWLTLAARTFNLFREFVYFPSSRQQLSFLGSVRQKGVQ